MSSFLMRSQSGKIWRLGETDSLGRAMTRGHADAVARAMGFELIGDEQGRECYHPLSCLPCGAHGDPCGAHQVGTRGHERCTGRPQSTDSELGQ